MYNGNPRPERSPAWLLKAVSRRKRNVDLRRITINAKSLGGEKTPPKCYEGVDVLRHALCLDVIADGENGYARVAAAKRNASPRNVLGHDESWDRTGEGIMEDIRIVRYEG